MIHEQSARSECDLYFGEAAHPHSQTHLLSQLFTLLPVPAYTIHVLIETYTPPIGCHGPTSHLPGKFQVSLFRREFRQRYRGLLTEYLEMLSFRDNLKITMLHKQNMTVAE